METIIETFEKNGLWITVLSNGKNAKGEDDFKITFEGTINADDFEEVTELVQKLKERLYDNQEQGYELSYRLNEL